MTDRKFEIQAFDECTSAECTPHHKKDDPTYFWNAESYQFMYVPSFQFQKLPGKRNYLYVAIDKDGREHTFTDDSPSSLLTPIWGAIPEGVVTLTVYSLCENGEREYPVGARTFFKLSPFTADLPDASKTYAECVKSAYDFALRQEVVRHWLTHGKPDPDYDLNVFPTKMISSIIDAMYSLIQSGNANREDALQIAVNAADYLLFITYREDKAVCGLPPTYQLDFRNDYEQRYNACAGERLDTIMMIYPAKAGLSYLYMEELTGDRKYFDAALTIAEYYSCHVLPNGTWYLVVDINSGCHVKENLVDPLCDIVPFLMKLYERTGDEKWQHLARNAVAYIENDALLKFNWEGQFEDSFMSVSYSNLTHYGAASLIHYYVSCYGDDSTKKELCRKLARFVEDQFVVWKKPAPWNQSGDDTKGWYTPAGLEQYVWHVPIDASTAFIMNMFLEMHKATGDELYLEKAKALANSITIMQREDGMIPTHWMSDAHRNGENFWINCHLHAASLLDGLDSYLQSL